MKLLYFLLLLAFSVSASEKVLLESPGETFIRLRQNRNWTFPAMKNPGRITVEFEHRIDFPRLGGWNPCWQIFVNGAPVSSMATRHHARLLNKSLSSYHKDHGAYRVCAGEKWYSLYSPDYELAKERFQPADPQAYRVVLDITDLLSGEKENTVTLRFGSELSGYYRSLGLKRVPALAVRNFRVVQSDVPSPIPPPVKEPDFIRMADVPAPDYTLERKNGELRIRYGRLAVPLESCFSAPGGKWFRMGDRETLETPLYSVSRRISRQKNRIDVFDTFTSRSDQLIGLKICYETSAAAFDPVYVAGDPAPNHSRNSGGRNPSVFLADRRNGQGIAFLAQDDVFRVQNIQYCENGKAGIRTETFALSPNESRTVEWSVYPVMSADYFDFVNEVRRDWDVNFPIEGGFHLSLNVFRTWTGEKARKFHRDAGLKFNSLGVLYWAHLGGEYAKRNSCIHGAALMDEKVRGRLAPSTITEFPVEPMRGFIRDMLAKARACTPDVKRFIYVHNQWSTEIGDAEKYADCALTLPNGKTVEEPPYRFFVPTAENAYGKRFMAFLKYLCDNFDIDGIYHDEFTYTRKFVTYNMWDKVSVELDKNHDVVRKIGFVPLLKLDFNRNVMDYVLNRRKKGFIANFSPETRSERKFKFPRFEETYNSWWIFLSHLYTPIQLGDMLTYSVTPEDCMAGIRNAMKNGALYYHYNNQAACPTITTKMYPFTPVEIHSGWLLGRERILTTHSGEFGWKGENSLCIPYVYNEKGSRIPGYPVKFTGTPQGTLCRIILGKKYCASLVRIPVSVELSGSLVLTDVQYEDNRFSCDAGGRGSAVFSFGKEKRKYEINGTKRIEFSVKDVNP